MTECEIHGELEADECHECEWDQLRADLAAARKERDEALAEVEQWRAAEAAAVSEGGSWERAKLAERKLFACGQERDQLRARVTELEGASLLWVARAESNERGEGPTHAECMRATRVALSPPAKPPAEVRCMSWGAEGKCEQQEGHEGQHYLRRHRPRSDGTYYAWSGRAPALGVAGYDCERYGHRGPIGQDRCSDCGKDVSAKPDPDTLPTLSRKVKGVHGEPTERYFSQTQLEVAIEMALLEGQQDTGRLSGDLSAETLCSALGLTPPKVTP